MSEQESVDMSTDAGKWKHLSNLALLEAARLDSPEAPVLPEHTMYWWAFQHIAVLEAENAKLREALITAWAEAFWRADVSNHCKYEARSRAELKYKNEIQQS